MGIPGNHGQSRLYFVSPRPCDVMCRGKKCFFLTAQQPWTGLLEVFFKSNVGFRENPALKSMVLRPVMRTECLPSLDVCYKRKVTNVGSESKKSPKKKYD